MNAESPKLVPEGIELPLCNVGIVLTKTMDQLFINTIRAMSLEQDLMVRSEIFGRVIPIIEEGIRKSGCLPVRSKTGCILLEGEDRVLGGICKALLKEDSQPARSVLFELLVTLMGNGWRRAEHLNAERV